MTRTHKKGHGYAHTSTAVVELEGVREISVRGFQFSAQDVLQGAFTPLFTCNLHSSKTYRICMGGGGEGGGSGAVRTRGRGVNRVIAWGSCERRASGRGSDIYMYTEICCCA